MARSFVKYCIISTVLTFVANYSFAQNAVIDSMVKWVAHHPKVDSQHILTLHRISYRSNEIDIKKSFEYYEKVSMLSDSIDFDYGRSLAQINLGILLATATNFEGSNTAYFSAIDFADAYGAERLKSVSLNNIGENFLLLNEPDKCREYTYAAIDINKKLEAWRGVAINYELLQQCDLKENKFEAAHKQLLTGMPYAELSGDPSVLSLYYIGFGKYRATTGHSDSAEYYFAKAQNSAKEQHDLRNIYQALMARVQFLNISDQKKIVLLDSALSIARQTGYKPGIAMAAEQLSAIYDVQGNKDKSLHFFRIYHAMNDSIFSENNRRNVVIKETDWKLKRQQLENKHLKEISEIQTRDISIKNTLLAGVVILLLLVMATAILFYIIVRGKKKRDEAAVKQKITEIKMQSLRAQMNPHFIFNSLNSIENFIMKNDKREASDYLTKFSALIRVILENSRVEQTPFTKDFDALRLYVELEQLRFNHSFRFVTHVDPELYNEDVLVPPLLIQPYVENAILHGLSQSDAPDKTLWLNAALENDHIIYTVKDNGIGRAKTAEYQRLNKQRYQSVGLQVTQERIDLLKKQLNREVSVDIRDLYDDEGTPAGTLVTLKMQVN